MERNYCKQVPDLPHINVSLTDSEEEDFEAWMAYRKAKRAKKEGGDQGKREKPLGGERAKNSINWRTGERNRRFTRNSEYH